MPLTPGFGTTVAKVLPEGEQHRLPIPEAEAVGSITSSPDVRWGLAINEYEEECSRLFSNVLNATTVTTGNGIRSLVDSIDSDRTRPPDDLPGFRPFLQLILVRVSTGICRVVLLWYSRKIAIC